MMLIFNNFIREEVWPSGEGRGFVKGLWRDSVVACLRLGFMGSSPTGGAFYFFSKIFFLTFFDIRINMYIY